MDAYIKGFSFIPGTNITTNDNLKYIQSGELEQTWKVARRERIKQRDQRIWEEFVQEQDVVSKICQDDPYQFLEQLPESCIQELLEVELQKIKQEQIEEEIQIQEEPQETPEDVNNECATTLVDSDKDSNVFHIFDDKDDDAGASGQEEVLNESVESVPCTVREKIEEKELEQPAVSRPNSGDKASSKSSENVSSLIESSIYCARIKDLRIKIKEELVDMISFLDQSTINIDPEELPRLSKRATEFSTRYQRVHVYQLQRQVHDMGRHAREGVVGAARHTHAHAQLARLVALHQSLLHAIQVLNKFVSRSGWSSETGSLVDTLAVLLRDASAADLTSVPKLTFDDQDMSAAIERLRAAVGARVANVTEYVNNMNTSSSYTSKSSKLNNKKKFIGNWSKSKPVESRLSMYSLGGRARTQRATPRSAYTGTPKPAVSAVNGDKSPTKPTLLKTEKTPRRRRVVPELHTLVEAVAPSTSSHMSREASPRVTPKSGQTSPDKTNTSRTRPKDKTRGTKQEYAPKAVDTERQKRRDESEIEKDGEGSKSNRSREKTRETKCPDGTPDDVNKLLRELCSGDGLSSRNDHTGPKNVQLVCVNSSSPRPPSTPQLLRILEETIQKKSPRLTPKVNTPIKDTEKLRMTLNIPEDVTEKLFQYRTKFVQHMLTSSLYANSAVGKPWEMIGSISDQIINELLLNCAKEMELEKFTEELYMSELC